LKLPVRGLIGEDLNPEILFNDPFSLVVSENELVDLVDEPGF
jgi:hypothetical protein